MTYPPRPANISIPAVVAGNILQNDDTSISAIDSGYDGAIVIKTQNKLAMLINPEQKTLINTENATAMLNINNDISFTPTLRLSYQDSVYLDMTITSTGTAVFSPTCDDISLDPLMSSVFMKDFDINDHDGVAHGLKLGGALITASASELNYVDVLPGAAVQRKAVILDANKNFSGINQLQANQLTGLLMTGDQPNITSLNRINITDEIRIRGEPLDVDPATMRYIKVAYEGIAYASKAMILDSSKNFIGINNLSANRITGTLTAGPQPYISSLSALQSLTNNGPTQLNATTTIMTAAGEHLVLKYDNTTLSSISTTTTGDMILRASSERVKVDVNHDFQVPSHNGATRGLYLGSGLVTATATQLNYVNVISGTANANRALVLDNDKNVVGAHIIGADILLGTLQTNAQPFINSVTVLNITNHNGTNAGLSLNGTLITSSALEINYLDTPPGIAQANKAIILDGAKNFIGIETISANSLSGVITTEEQPNIKRVDTLTITNHNGTTTGLKLASTLVVATGDELNYLAVDQGSGIAGKALILDGSKNITGINNVGATYLTGIIQTVVQPNISQVNALNIAAHNGTSTGLALNGTLITSSAMQLNRVNVLAGSASRDKALVLDSSLSISGINILNANSLGGVLTNPSQPNIRNLTSINVVDHDGGSTGLLLNGSLITSTAAQLNYVNVQQGVAAGSKAIVLSGTKDIAGINVLRAAELYGVLRSTAQPYITNLSTLNIIEHNGTTGLSLGGTLITASANEINRLTVDVGTAQSGKVLTTDNAKNIQGINSLSATSLTGTITTTNQPNINSVNTLNIVNHNGTNGLSLAGNLITASAAQINRINTAIGVASEGKALIVDSTRNISNINSLVATSITGIIQTSHQPNITSTQTLNIVNHDGGSNGLRLNGTLVSATATQLNYTSVVAGMATSFRALVTNEFNSIAGINSLTATKLSADTFALTGVVSNFNTGGIVIKSYSFTDLVGRMINIQLLTSLSFVNFIPADNISSGYSCEIIGYIKPTYSENYTFYTTCNDRVRLWVNGEMLLHSWVKVVGARASTTIFLNADQWVPIYIQYQVDTNSAPYFLLEWSSLSNGRTQIPTERMAWDNNPPAVSSNHYSQNVFTIYNTSTTTASTAKFAVDTSGDLTIDASGNDITLGANDNLNIPSHNGSTRGLQLGGVLVQPTAYEINYLKVSPGIVSASHALVVDASKSIAGINSITATSISCNNLSTNAFTISNLSLSGPLNNYNTGSLLVRQITGPNVNGRVVNVDTITDINLNNYDPRELNENYSVDIIGYILPLFTEQYRFHVTANDYARLWVNNTPILNSWATESIGLEYTSDPILLTANQWVPIYIQYQNVSNSSILQVRWSSTSLVKSFINSAYMAWDNTLSRPFRELNSADRLTLFSSATGLTSVQTGTISVDGNGNMSLTSKSGVVSVVSGTNFNIAGHNGTRGLQLNGNLVTATAAELNYLSGVATGNVVAGKAIVLDANRSLTGFNVIGADEINGVLKTAAQPFITSFGTLSSPLTSSSDIILTSTNSLRLTSDATACYIQAGSSTTANASADIFIGNYGSSVSTSSRKLMIKASGFVGIQTSSPTRTLTINGAGDTYCMRLVNNSTTGSETAYCDIGVDASSNLRIASNIIVGAIGTGTISVSSSGMMKIAPSGGSLQIGNTSNSVMPLEVGSSTFSLSSVVGYLNSEGSVGSVIPTATAYSIRTTSSIIVNGTICVASDRRLKEQIMPMAYDACRDFIMKSQPVMFKYINDPFKTSHCGLIAQDVSKTEFSDLVKIAPYGGLSADIDDDGFVSPANAAFNVAYEEIVPILMTTMKKVMIRNEELESEVDDLKRAMCEMKLRMLEFERRFS